MSAVELVEEPDGERRVVEGTRLPGQNNVSTIRGAYGGDNVTSAVELVVEPDGERRVVEVTRLPGQNNVSTIRGAYGGDNVTSAVELVEEPDGERRVVEGTRLPGQNNVSTIRGAYGGDNVTSAVELVVEPDGERRCPEGRDIILIANDLTYFMGSFGPQEDWVFYKASAYARELKIPRVKSEFNVAWIDSERPDRGFKYLYLSPESFSKLGPLGSVKTQLIEDEGESRYKITDIIGPLGSVKTQLIEDEGESRYKITDIIGPLGSVKTQLIDDEGESRYKITDIIGPLGSVKTQLIDDEGESRYKITDIIALNKVLGRPVYASNNQLGGIQIMHNNGVSHAVASTDLDAVWTAVKWLSFVPKWVPPRGPHDPRLMLNGEGGRGGFFDAGSFDEIMQNWAQTVITVRALRGATAPVIVYIPPGAELRGGAWAVVDPSVNSQRME
ncbi:Acetyl-coA carboxylase, partial [Operophtera brumata]